MKKTVKIRLTLNRETLRNLVSDEMSGAQGGALVVTTTDCTVLVTNSCYNCVSQTCPTRCGQWYCHGV
ncbi:MAG TPA: hypothetical protein VGH73_11145 [Thermoanaerobaculia bacterium]|jgi:hypothetical protein